MVDYKYHITSLVAIFLALGIGILIGSTMVGSDYIVAQQQILIDRLENDFNKVRNQTRYYREELTTAQESLNLYREFSKKVLPILVKDKLRDLRVAIIQTNANTQADNVVKVLQMAGANIRSVTTIMDDFALANVSSMIYPDLPEPNQVARLVAHNILMGDEENVLAGFSGQKMLRTVGSIGEPLDAVIFLGGSKTGTIDQVKWLDLAMVDFFLEQNIKVVGVEESNVSASYMTWYQTKPVSTVDNIETAPGKIALVYALCGYKGHYGTKKTARKLIPDLW